MVLRVRSWAAFDIAMVMIGATTANLTVLRMPSLAALAADARRAADAGKLAH
ncbi:MAG TPA: hypothetical protein VEJ67_06270 [Candidatus Cybelea sp.]|nr:hypothetical protein [Candidatus Cybelea sp.]